VAVPPKSSENRDFRRAELIARGLGLTGEAGAYGPADQVSITPTPEADALARWLAAASLEPLRRFVGHDDWTIELTVSRPVEPLRPPVWGTRLERESVPVRIADIPRDRDPVGHFLGLPLTVSLKPGLAARLRDELVARFFPSERPKRSARRILARQLIAQEAMLWDFAAARGGPSRTLPFATRVRALRWWWEPEPGRQPAETICLRCGWVMVTRAIRTGPPFCDHCVKDKTLERNNAIAPAERGTWWLRCSAAGCSNAFVARPQARRCPPHRLAGIAPSKRPGR
jgi:hypothetical protein